MSENPNYYAIIPAFVRYSQDLKANEKLLYGEITCLSNKSWECFASNAYFAELYWVSERQITEWIQCLFRHGFIDVRIEKKEWNKRYISITPNKEKSTDITKKTSRGYRRKVPEGIEENFHTPIEENFQYNNININNINNNNISNEIDKSFGDSEINFVFDLVKNINEWITDDFWKKSRIDWKNLIIKLKKIKNVVNWKFTRKEYLEKLLWTVKKNSYYSHKISSVSKIYYNLTELIDVANKTYNPPQKQWQSTLSAIEISKKQDRIQEEYLASLW